MRRVRLTCRGLPMVWCILSRLLLLMVCVRLKLVYVRLGRFVYWCRMWLLVMTRRCRFVLATLIWCVRLIGLNVIDRRNMYVARIRPCISSVRPCRVMRVAVLKCR